MSLITITIEDTPGGGVKVVANPSLETLFKIIESGHELTSAHGYAFTAINAIRKSSTQKEPSRILVPKRGRW